VSRPAAGSMMRPPFKRSFSMSRSLVGGIENTGCTPYLAISAVRNYACAVLSLSGGCAAMQKDVKRTAQRAPSIRSRLLAARQRSPLLGRPGFLIRRLHQLHCSLFLEETRDFAITPVQYSLMTALAARGELDQNTLALEIGLERTSVAEVVPRLQRRGLLMRRRSGKDRRVKLVRLTRKGGALLHKMAAAVQRAHDRTIDRLENSKRDAFLLHLIELVEANNEVGSVPFRLPQRT
jgi:MarR family transcriptional regulator, lower aerobic nicotinate degradation pathway regulator